MATAPTPSRGSGDVIGCELTGREARIRFQRWMRLIREAGLGRVETPAGLRLRFRDEPAADRELRALVAAERECCSWAQWSIHRAAGELIVHVTAAPAGTAALHYMFAAGSTGSM